MTNADYEPNNIGGFLVIWRKPGEKFYVIASPDTQPGHYAEIRQGEIQTENLQSGEYWQGSRHIVTGHKSLIILRQEIVDGKGGLDAVVKQIKERTFRLGLENGGQE